MIGKSGEFGGVEAVSMMKLAVVPCESGDCIAIRTSGYVWLWYTMDVCYRLQMAHPKPWFSGCVTILINV